MLLDLLTREEEQIDEYTRHLRFDIELLANRVIAAVGWSAAQHELAPLRVGLFEPSNI